MRLLLALLVCAADCSYCPNTCCCYDQPYNCRTTSICWNAGYQCTSCATSGSQCVTSQRRRSAAICDPLWRPRACNCSHGEPEVSRECSEATAKKILTPDRCEHCDAGYKLVNGSCIPVACEDFTATLQLNRSSSQGCASADWRWCEQLALSPFRAHYAQCCEDDEHCRLLRDMNDSIQFVYSLNLGDMILEIGSCVLTCLVVFSCMSRTGDEDYFTPIRLSGCLIGLMLVADIILQILVLIKSNALLPNAQTLLKRNCIDIVTGRHLDQALVGLQNDIENSIVLGWIELAFGFAGVFSEVVDFISPGGNGKRVLLLLAAFSDMLLATVEFVVLTAPAASDMDLLFEAVQEGSTSMCVTPARSAVEFKAANSVASVAYRRATVGSLLCLGWGLLLLLRSRKAN